MWDAHCVPGMGLLSGHVVSKGFIPAETLEIPSFLVPCPPQIQSNPAVPLVLFLRNALRKVPLLPELLLMEPLWLWPPFHWEGFPPSLGSQ